MGDAQDKIEELMRLFDRVLEFCENSSLLDEASESYIKENFAMAASVEKIYCKLQQTGCIDAMQTSVLDHWEQMGRNVPSEVTVFEEACDHLLTACFRHPSLTCRNLCTAVTEYERYCGSDRLQELVVYLLREGISCQLLHTLASAPPSLVSAVYLGWCSMLECGQSAKVKTLVTTTLSKNPTYVSSVLQVILKPNEEDDNTSLKTLLIDCVVAKMREENSKDFCLCLVNSTDVVVLVSVAKNYPTFLTALLESLEILANGAEYQCEQVGGGVKYSWKELGFPLNLVQQLCRCEGPVGSRTLSWLTMLQSRPGCSLWEDVAACCGV